jgi:hypothetical protein
VIPLAEGEKDQRIRDADGYRLKRINEAEGDVARFSALLAEYGKAPEATRRRIYIETLQDVMPGIRSKIIVDEQTRSILPLLNLDSQKGDDPLYQNGANVSDKSPKSKQRNQSQKKIAKAKVAAKTKARQDKQARVQTAPPTKGKK